MASILESLTDGLTITEYSDWLIFVERLNGAVREGRVRKVPIPAIKNLWSRTEEWFLDPKSAEVYSYQPPDPPVYPRWQKVDVLSRLETPDPTPLSVIKVGQMTPMMAHIMKLKIEALADSGLVEVLPTPPTALASRDRTERWYKDNVSGMVYRLREHYGLEDADDIRWEIVPQSELTARIQ
jgi:hypothetical protein